MNQFSRTELLIGKEALKKLRNSAVAVFGVGGVGSYAAEALARGGVGRIAVCDNDKVCLTNINRQLIATHKTIDRNKVDVIKERILDINPDACVEVLSCFYGAENAGEIDLSKYSYVIDAIDTVSSKIILIEKAKEANVPIISCMGAGNKLDPTKFEVDDIYSTSVCPLARVMRKELRDRGIDSLKVVYSKEQATTPIKEELLEYKNDYDIKPDTEENAVKRQIPGSVSFVPPVAGFILAGEVIKALIYSESLQ